MKALFLTFRLLCAADSATTHYAIMHGAHEAGWAGHVTQNPDALDAMNAGQCMAVEAIGKKLPKKAAVPVLVASIVARGWAVQHNVRVVR
jgi:diphthamide biosynthesis methyltransferase